MQFPQRPRNATSMSRKYNIHESDIFPAAKSVLIFYSWYRYQIHDPFALHSIQCTVKLYLNITKYNLAQFCIGLKLFMGFVTVAMATNNPHIGWSFPLWCAIYETWHGAYYGQKDEVRWIRGEESRCHIYQYDITNWWRVFYSVI